MNQSPVYITGLGNVSPQPATAAGSFPALPAVFESNLWRCSDPGYKEFIPAEMIRRMSRIIKMGVAAARLCLRDAGCDMPDAIITGTGLGCMEDTEKFLTSLIRNNEELLTPTSFIQSTHNTVAGQIALLLQCHSYNFTYVHRGISFESALIDAITRIRTGESSHVLAGGTDELTTNYFTITDRMGFWKRKPVDSLHLFADTTRGTVAGEGAAFFLLQNNPGGKTYARLDGITTFLDPGSFDGVTQKMDAFLQSQQTAIGDIDLVLLGMNGDPGSDGIYHFLASNRLKNTPLAYFKHLSGEYHTASSFALWLAAMILKDGRVPEIVRPESLPGTPQKQVQVPGSIRKLLIYNHFRKNNHSLILLSRP